MPRLVPTARLFNRFAHDRSGGIAILFALLALPVCGIMGAALDYGMAMRAHSTLQRATDAAAAAALPNIPLGADVVSKTLRAHFDVNVPDAYKGLALPFTMDDDPPFISVKVETKVQTTVLAIMGVENMPVRVEGLAQLAESKKTFEIPKDLDEPSPELSGNGSALPPEAIQEAQHTLSELGIRLSPQEIQAMAEQAMREMQRGNLR